MSASKALRIARATRNHGETFTQRWHRSCAFNRLPWSERMGWTRKAFASLLLDGFSVDDITAVGG